MSATPSVPPDLSPLEAAIESIDRANQDDPNRFEGEPLALVQGRLAHHWVGELTAGGASTALVLAARGHHLRRWALPRTDYPEGRAGYLRWRRDQKRRHAEDLAEIARSAGLSRAVADRVGEIVRKRKLESDPEVQTFEDAVCLTFVQTQFDTTTVRLGHEQMVDVTAKTLKKMSPDGRARALELHLAPELAAIIQRALAG